MAAINDLIAQIRDDALRQQIEAELRKVMKHKRFGLVFEDHLPEGVNEGPIYPGLEVVDWVKGTHSSPSAASLGARSSSPATSPWHTLIEADNYYALQLLAYLYPGKVDCIYIDPPYNTGARDWKYNNDYVDTADQYRHSKWLSMMKRRLLIAKRLLNPKDSVLIVTIDEKEYLHLGCLLEELFPVADMQMISSVIMPSGSSRAGRFGRADEYIFYLFFGEATVKPWKTDMLRDIPQEKISVRWNGLIRNGEGSKRTRIPSLFYPILLDKETGKLVSIENPIPANMKVENYKVPEGLVALWPIDKSGNELMWRLYPPTLKDYFEKGYAKLGKRDPQTGLRPITYLQSGMIEKVENGQIKVLGRDEEGALILEYAEGGKSYAPLTVWNRVSHSAAEHGSGVLKKILTNRHFPFPKSLYAVQDTLRFVVANKPDALIVDFFAGSGTTLHAVNLLNAEDGGHRRCIMVTNNEVSAEEAKTLTKQGFKPGDDEWEKLGIARYVCWPRTVCAIRGVDVNGVPLKGEYLGTHSSPSAGNTAAEDGRVPMSNGFDSNCIYFKLRFLDKDNVALGKQFRELLPLLWLRSGAKGMCPIGFAGGDDRAPIPDMLILPENGFAVLNEVKVFGDFIEQIKANESISDVYLIVDSQTMFREMTRTLQSALPSTRHIQTCQLYRDYLDNFRINNQR